MPGSGPAVRTGVAVEIPAGHAGLVMPRSGLASRHGIALVNAPGLIDSGYRGEVQVLLLNTDRTQTCQLAAGDRIAQLVLIAVATPAVVEVDALGHSERGAGGFGSSGGFGQARRPRLGVLSAGVELKRRRQLKRRLHRWPAERRAGAGAKIVGGRMIRCPGEIAGRSPRAYGRRARYSVVEAAYRARWSGVSRPDRSYCGRLALPPR